MHDSVQQTWRSLFDSFAYVVLTRNLFPQPENISREIERHVNIIGALAYPDPQERAAAIQKIMENIRSAQGQ